jgi:hypothetical protein
MPCGLCDGNFRVFGVQVEGWQQPAKISLGLLPSGPDPVGEHNACANLPRRFMVGFGWNGKGWGACNRTALL